jgi:exodeoxyribonuclease VII large subunit
MQPNGIGSLHLAFEQLKIKLASEGLFDEYHKKSIPKYPNSIGIITSSTGAAIRDIINVCSRRNPSVKLVLYPTLVQGADAPAELIKAVEYFNIEKNVDVLIIGRGGGSIEDLWAFNDEGLARAIYNSEIPVISGVGHEIDFTICDFVADIRAATPSAAAEIATTDIKVIYSMLESFEKKAYNAISSKINSSRELLKHLASCKMLNKPETMLEIPRIRLLSYTNNLKLSILDIQKSQRERFAEINAKLVALNPMAVLSRGYGAVYKENKIVKSVNDVAVGEKIMIKMSDGTINAIVSEGEEDG